MGLDGVTIRTTGRSFPGDTPAWYADTSKVRALGFEPTVPLREGLSRTIEWLRANAAPAGDAEESPPALEPSAR